MLAEKANFRLSIDRLCRLLKVSRSGYYAWLVRTESFHVLEDRRLSLRILVIFEESGRRYGSPRVFDELRAQGERVSEKRVARLMREARIHARTKHRWKQTTDSDHDHPIAKNVLKRKFEVSAPNRAWVADTTYIPTAEGWLYLVAILDLFSRRVVGWSAGGRLSAELTCSALRMALTTRAVRRGVVFHTDRGAEFASREFSALVCEYQLKRSMSRKGNCWDNAVAESFFSTLKVENTHRHRYRTRSEARLSIFRYIEGFYNRRRRHSTLGSMSPEQYEQSRAA